MNSLDQFLLFVALPGVLIASVLEAAVLWRRLDYDWRAAGVSMLDLVMRVGLQIFLPLSRKNTSRSASSAEGVSTAPYNSAWPLGSCIRPVRNLSWFCIKYWRFASTVSPSKAGNPAVKIRNGSPPVWVSMLVIFSQDCGGCQFHLPTRW